MKKAKQKYPKYDFSVQCGPTHEHHMLKRYLNEALDEQISSMNHRGEPFATAVFKETARVLKLLNRVPRNYEVYFGPNATYFFTASANVVKNKCVVISQGAFGRKWAEKLKNAGKNVTIFEVPDGEVFNFAKFELPAGTEAVFMTALDTSTGVCMTQDDAMSLKKRYPRVILGIDVVSAEPYTDIDLSMFDIVVCSGQKQFRMPGGLGWMFASPLAVGKAHFVKESLNGDVYPSMVEMHNSYEKGECPDTPNALFIRVLGKMCQRMRKEGGQKKIRRVINERYDRLNELITDYAGNLEYFIEDELHRSKAVLAIDVSNNAANALVKAIKEKGIDIGGGYGVLKSHQIRIANFDIMTDKEFDEYYGRLAQVFRDFFSGI